MDVRDVTTMEEIPKTHGINQDLKINDRVLHIQTEDLGHVNQEILTVIYSAGEIIFSLRNPYSYFARHNLGELTSERMVEVQHKGIVASVRSGRLLNQLKHV